MKIQNSPQKIAAVLGFLLACLPFLRALGAPAVSNVSFSQRPGTRTVDVYYDLSLTGSTASVALDYSSDGGVSFVPMPPTVSGAVGDAIPGGTAKNIVWDAGTDWPGQVSNEARFRVVAWDLLGPGGMAFAAIDAGSYQRGDNLDGTVDEPVQTVAISKFYLSQTEVTKAQWDTVRAWAIANGYSDMSAGSGKASNHPVQSVTWFDVLKWCNAASEMEGLAPCYALSGTVFKTGATAPSCNWSANGYRLPTEAEWEKVSRGGAVGKRFAFGDAITHSVANYYSVDYYAYDVSPTRGYHPTYSVGGTPYTSPVGSFPATGYGMLDMAGNVYEWCWDWYGSYVASADPKGPDSGSSRVIRGGSWKYDSRLCQCPQRRSADPAGASWDLGFRPARSRP